MTVARIRSYLHDNFYNLPDDPELAQRVIRFHRTALPESVSVHSLAAIQPADFADHVLGLCAESFANRKFV